MAKGYNYCEGPMWASPTNNPKSRPLFLYAYTQAFMFDSKTWGIHGRLGRNSLYSYVGTLNIVHSALETHKPIDTQVPTMACQEQHSAV